MIAPAQHNVKHADKFYMLVATVARLVLSLASFVVIVRFLGPEAFGFYAACLAVASVASAVTDFGLTTSALRDASMDRERIGEITGDAFALKLMFSLICTLVLGLAAGWILSGEDWSVFLLLLLGMLAYSAADLLMVAARASGRFDLEAKVVVLTGIAMFAVVAGVAILTRDLLAVAAAFAITRALYLVCAGLSLRTLLRPFRLLGRGFANLFETARSASAYAVDSILTILSGQIDVLVFATMLALAELGTYQAGARLVQVIVPFAVMLSSVYLPALSAAFANRHGKADFRAISGRMILEFTVLGAFGAAAFLFAGPIITNYVYGPAFADLNALWPGFAVYAVLRFTAAGFGIQLVALGQVRFRNLSHVVSLCAFAIIAVVVVPKYGFAASSWVMVTMGLSAFLVMGISLMRTSERHSAVAGSFIATACLAAAIAILA